MELLQFLQAVAILVVAAAVPGVPVLLWLRHRGRQARAWRDAEAVAMWEPHVVTGHTWSPRAGEVPAATVMLRKVARRPDINTERVLRKLELSTVRSDDAQFDKKLQVALEQARTSCQAINNARF